MRSTKLFGAVIALTAIACGGSGDDLCSRLGSALNGLIAKETPCFPNPPVIPFTAAQCNATLPRCTDADKRIFGDFTNCLNALPTCTVATQTAFAIQAQTCTNNANAISAACR